MYTVDESVAEILVLGFMAVPAISALISRVITKQHITFGRPAVLTLLLALIPAVGNGRGISAAYLPAVCGDDLLWLGRVDRCRIDRPSASIRVCAPSGARLTRESAAPLATHPLLSERELTPAGDLVRVSRAGDLRSRGVLNYRIPHMGKPCGVRTGDFGLELLRGAPWEKHRDVWGATFAHGSWNYLVQSAWPLIFVSASPWIMGEFGIVAGVFTIAIALMWVPRVARRHRAPLES